MGKLSQLLYPSGKVHIPRSIQQLKCTWNITRMAVILAPRIQLNKFQTGAPHSQLSYLHLDLKSATTACICEYSVTFQPMHTWCQDQIRVISMDNIQSPFY